MSWISGMIKELNSLRTKILSLPDDPDRSAPVPVVVEEEQVNYTDFRTHELKTMAKERGLKGK